MKTKDLLKSLINSPDIYYIYEDYWMEDTKPHFTIVGNLETTPVVSDAIIDFYTTESWFELVAENSIEIWMRTCLPRKYIIKEYVKPTLVTDPLALRKAIDREALSNTLYGTNPAADLYAATLFSNQVIENHKIVNYGNVVKGYQAIYKDPSVFCSYWNPEFDRLCETTDGMLKLEKEKKYGKK